MNEIDREIIKTHIHELCKLIDLSSIVPFILARGIFNQAMMDDIMSLNNDNERKTRLLHDLCRRGPDAYDKFVAVLRDTRHVDALSLLRPPRYRKESLPLHLEFGKMGIELRHDLDNKVRHHSFGSEEHKRESAMNELDGTRTVTSRINIIQAPYSGFHENSYTMESKPRGYCLLINNVDFENELFEARHGSDTDAKNLDEVFQELGFNVILKRNLIASDMKKIAKQVSKKSALKEMDAFVMIVLSHGYKDVVYGCDNLIVDIFKDLVKPFNNENCPSLIGKPKMFFFQACRGDKKDFGVTIPKELPRTLPGYSNVKLVSEASGDSQILALSNDLSSPLQLCAGIPDSIPLPSDVTMMAQGSWNAQLCANKIATFSDILISFPTVFGYVAMRNPELGSWYCTALVQALAEYSHKWRLIDILSRVDKEVQRMQSYLGDKQATTVQLIGWQKHLYFNPGIYKSDST